MPNILEITARCLAGGGNGKAPPPPEKKPPPETPDCSVFVATPLQNGLPLPGSQDFCDQIGQIRKGFTHIADVALKQFTAENFVSGLLDSAKISQQGAFTEAVLGLVFRAWNLLIDAFKEIVGLSVKYVGGLLKGLTDLYLCAAEKVDAKAALGIWFVKQLIRLLDRVRVGWDIGLWATTEVPVTFDQFQRWLDLLEDYFVPINIPSESEATRAWLLDRIDKDRRDCIWQLHGLKPSTYEPFAETEREQLDWREAIQYVRRAGAGDEQERKILRQRGFTEALDVQMAQEMFDELPTIADHLHWTQRNVFDADYVRDFKLLDNFEEKFWPAFGEDLHALGMKKKYAQLHYAAHWVMPSPEQMREFVYRSQEIAAATGKGFTIQDYERVLTEQDYNVLARGWFTATVYQVPAISYIKEWYRQNVIDKDELTEYHHRLGFAPKDAERFADIDDIQKRRMRASASKGWTTTAATNAWFAGQIGADRHEQIYFGLGYDSQEAQTARDVADASFAAATVKRARMRTLSTVVTAVAQAVDVGVMTPQAAADNLVRAGWTKRQADGYATLLTQTGSIRKVRQAITYVRRHVIDGGISLAVAQQELQRLGITAGATANYLALWRLQMTPGRKKRTAAQIVADVANGHITTADAINRLVNLGYNDADTRLYMADAQAKLVKMEQARIAALNKQGLQRAAQQSKLLKEADAQRRRIVADMLKVTPIKTLQSWAKQGIIGHKQFLSRMKDIGFDRDIAEGYYREACKSKAASCVEDETLQEGAGGGGGGGGSDGGGSEVGARGVPPAG